MAEESLKDKTVKGVGWSAADVFLGNGITFIVGIVLARILSPEEYGLIGIVLIFTTILDGVVDSGFSNALIRKKTCTDEDYSTMFITNIGFSIALYVALFFSAGPISVFFERPQLVALIRTTGLVVIINATSLVQYTRLTRNIDFKSKTKASLIAAVLSGVVGIVMALCGFGVWSLAGQKLSNKILYSLGLWIVNKWIPKISFNISSFRYMWGFGWKIMLSGLLNRVWGELYQTVVAKFYSPATLGQYSRSKEYANVLSSNFTMIVQRVSYPVLSQIQDDKQRLIAGYKRVIKVAMFITVISMFSMGAVAEPLIYCLIGPQWHQAATFLPLICVSLSLYPLHAINLNMLQVQGRSDIFLILEIIKKVISIGPLCVGIFIDIYWMLIASIVTGVISFFLNTWYTGKSLGYTSWMQIKDVSSSFILATIIALAVYFLKYLPLNYWLILLFQFIVGTAVFFIFCECIGMEEYKIVKDIAVGFISKIKDKKK